MRTAPVRSRGSVGLWITLALLLTGTLTAGAIVTFQIRGKDTPEDNKRPEPSWAPREPFTNEERIRLRKEYPLESLFERLAHERRPGKRAHGKLPDASTSEVPRDSWTRLGGLESETAPTHTRNASLELLHTDAVEEFVKRPGFGQGRFDPGPAYLAPEKEPGAPLVGDVRIVFDPELTYERSLIGLIVPPPAFDLPFWSIHQEGLVEFAYSSGFGYVRDRDHVAGFRPHQFRSVPTAWGQDRGKTTWQVRKLELVSLLKYDQPAVYVSDRLPSMASVAELKTRPLDEFESSALAALRRGEDLLRSVNGDTLRVLGSVRVGTHCLKCHEAERGDLLGAFSYQLKREPPAKTPTD